MSSKFRKERRHKRHIPRRIEPPMVVSADHMLRPVELLLDRLEDGDHSTSIVDGTAVFRVAGSKDWCDIASALLGIVDVFEIWSMRHEKSIPLEPLRQLAHRLKYGMSITELETGAVRRVLPLLRRVAAFLDRGEADDLIRTTQIKELMETRAC